MKTGGRINVESDSLSMLLVFRLNSYDLELNVIYSTIIDMRRQYSPY